MAANVLAIDHEFSWDQMYGGFLPRDANPFRKHRTAEATPAADARAEPAPSPKGQAVANLETAAHALRRDAERYLRETGTSIGVGADGAWLKRAALKARKASRHQHLESIAAAFAASIQIAASPHRAELVKTLEEATGRKRSATTLDLHLIVERFIAYGGDTPAERAAARKLVSRDVRAIQHLEAKRVLPSQVVALGSRPGEGLHSWARRQSSKRETSTTVAGDGPVRPMTVSERLQRALVHEVVVTTLRPDGSQKARSQFRLTDMSAAEVDRLTAYLGKLAGPSEP